MTSKPHLEQLEDRCLPAPLAFALAPATPAVWSEANTLTEVVRAYQHFTQTARLPSEGELARYLPFAKEVARTHDVWAAEQIEVGVMASAESLAGFSSKEVVDKTFIWWLGRPPGVSESSVWSERLEAVGKDAVLWEIATSPEANQQHARTNYGQLFFRQPSEAELRAWASIPWLEQDRIFLDSPEFAALNPIDEAEDAAYPITTRYAPQEFLPTYPDLYAEVMIHASN